MSSLSTPTWSACAVFTLVTVSATNSRAGTIVGLSPFLDPGIYSIAAQGVIPGTANNDNIAGTSDNQLFILQKDYVSVGFVDIVATVVDSGGVTEYVVNENVQNSTTVDWTGYRIELGFGTGVDFIPSTVGDGLDVDTPDDLDGLPDDLRSVIDRPTDEPPTGDDA